MRTAGRQKKQYTSSSVGLNNSQQFKVNKRHSTVFFKSFSLISLMRKIFEAIWIKTPDYSLGVLSNLAKNLNRSKQIPLESPSQNKGTLTVEHTLRNAEQVFPRPSSFIWNEAGRSGDEDTR